MDALTRFFCVPDWLRCVPRSSAYSSRSYEPITSPEELLLYQQLENAQTQLNILDQRRSEYRNVAKENVQKLTKAERNRDSTAAKHYKQCAAIALQSEKAIQKQQEALLSRIALIQTNLNNVSSLQLAKETVDVTRQGTRALTTQVRSMGNIEAVDRITDEYADMTQIAEEIQNTVSDSLALSVSQTTMVTPDELDKLLSQMKIDAETQEQHSSSSSSSTRAMDTSANASQSRLPETQTSTLDTDASRSTQQAVGVIEFDPA